MSNTAFRWVTLFFVLATHTFPATAEQQRILLNDGTELVGEVISLKNGSYTIRSNTLGTLKLSNRQVRQISSLGTTEGAQLSGSITDPVETAKGAMNGSQMQALQQRMMGDTAMLQQIMALQSSPEMKAILSDPEVMSAIQNFDLDALAKNPKIKRLMNNQDVRAISGKMN